MNLYRITGIALLCVGAFVLAGCGEKSEPETSATPGAATAGATAAPATAPNNMQASPAAETRPMRPGAPGAAPR